MQEATHIQSFDSPVMYLTRTHLRPEYLFIKRAFDIVSSLLAIIILSPIMLITALAIRLYDGGPALYKQVRLTKDGKTFKIWKFRSMRVDAEKDGIARLSTGDNDDRITPIGKIVRKCRLDGSVIIRQTRKKPLFATVSPVLSNSILPPGKRFLIPNQRIATAK